MALKKSYSLSLVFFYTSLAMAAFAANSLLCRLALKETSIDPASFTLIRIMSGVIILGLLCRKNAKKSVQSGSYLSSLFLFIYAVGFSYAYIDLDAGTGALILFACVQITMISYGVLKGEKFNPIQVFGIVLACVGLIILNLPGVSVPSIWGALLMSAAGIAWGIYSIRGRVVKAPLLTTTGNFLFSLPLAVGLALINGPHLAFDSSGMFYAILSGALASGAGYAIWYKVLPMWTSSGAATIQLSVPVIAALGGMLFIDEPLTFRFVSASVFILGGIFLVIRK